MTVCALISYRIHGCLLAATRDLGSNSGSLHRVGCYRPKCTSTTAPSTDVFVIVAIYSQEDVTSDVPRTPVSHCQACHAEEEFQSWNVVVVLFYIEQLVEERSVGLTGEHDILLLGIVRTNRTIAAGKLIA